MSSRQPAVCSHELRPGTSVCLHCRREARLTADARTRELAVRGGTVALVVAVLAAAGMAGAGALRASRATATGSAVTQASMTGSTAEPAAVATDSLAVEQASSQLGIALDSAAGAPSPRAVPTVPSPAAAPIAPSVSEGRTELEGGAFAERRGDTVAVHFDVSGMRTRRPERFERVVRSTLPRVFGADGTAALAAAPDGWLARPLDQLTAPEHPVRLVAGGRTILLWAEQREGHDGPLLVAYRAVAAR